MVSYTSSLQCSSSPQLSDKISQHSVCKTEKFLNIFATFSSSGKNPLPTLLYFTLQLKIKTIAVYILGTSTAQPTLNKPWKLLLRPLNAPSLFLYLRARMQSHWLLVTISSRILQNELVLACLGLYWSVHFARKVHNIPIDKSYSKFVSLSSQL
jgi:hypothetical protein